MQAARILEIVNDVEQRFNVCAWEIGGVRVWPLVRILIFEALRDRGRARLPSSLSQRLVAGGRLLSAARKTQRRDPPHRPLHASADAVFLSHNGYRSKVDGLWVDRFSDPIADEIEAGGGEICMLERLELVDAPRVPRRRPAYVVEFARLWEDLRHLLRFPLSSSPLPDDYIAFKRHIDDATTESIANIEWKAVAHRMAMIEGLAGYFSRAFAHAKPATAFLTNYYSYAGFAYVLAAWRKTIPTVDIQHGTIKHHVAYDRWLSVPPDGFAMLPSRFWSWQESDAEAINQWAARTGNYHQAFTGGNPWMEFWGQRNTPPNLQREFGRHKNRHVLLSLQWDAGLCAQLKELLKASPRNWHWWVRLHPISSDAERKRVRTWCERHLPERCNIDDATQAALPLLLRNCDLHVTRFSSVVIEAAACGVPSIVMHPTARDYFAGEIESGIALEANTPADAVRLMSNLPNVPSGLKQTYAPARPQIRRCLQELGTLRRE